MDVEIISFSPVLMAETFRTYVTHAFNCVLKVPAKGTKLFLSLSLVLTKDNLFAPSKVYNVHILLPLGKSYEKYS